METSADKWLLLLFFKGTFHSFLFFSQWTMHIQSELLHLFDMTMGMFPTWLVESILRNPGAFSDILISSQKAHSLGSLTMGLNRYSPQLLSLLLLLLLLLLCSSLCKLLLCCLLILEGTLVLQFFVFKKIFVFCCFFWKQRNRLWFHLLKKKKKKWEAFLYYILYFLILHSTRLDSTRLA